jgi:MFS family permease
MTFEGWSTLRYRDFALACGARFAVTLALHITNVAIGWYIYDVTSSALALGYLGLAGLFPGIILVLVTGYVSDRFDRRHVMFWSDLVLTVTAGALLWLVASGSGLVWPIYIIIVFSAASRAFHNPAAQAIIPGLVPADQLPTAVAFASGAFQGAQILGPALGGLLYAVDGWLAFATAGTLYAMSAIGVLLIRRRQATSSAKVPLSFGSLLAGFEFAWRKPVVLGAVALDSAVVLLGGVVWLLPIFAKDILHVGPLGLGLLRAAPAVGALMMAMWLANNVYVQRNTGPKLFRTIAVFGLAIAAFGRSQSFVLSMLLLVVVGAADMVSVVIRHTMVQAETPDGLRGRVSAVNSLFITSASEIGQLRAGVMAWFIGAVPTVVIGGLAAAGLFFLWPRLFPSLAKRDHLVEPESARA